jgi:hypothetical protein
MPYNSNHSARIAHGCSGMQPAKILVKDTFVQGQIGTQNMACDNGFSNVPASIEASMVNLSFPDSVKLSLIYPFVARATCSYGRRGRDSER